jgi:hypothetical protein
MNQYCLSVQTKADICSAYQQGISPMSCATTLRLAMTTVIAEYIRLDSI